MNINETREKPSTFDFTKCYMERHAKQRLWTGAIMGLIISSNMILRICKYWGDWNWWNIIFTVIGILCILCMVFGYSFIMMGCKNYQIKEGNLCVGNKFWSKEQITIPIQSIRFVEKLAHKWYGDRTIRIMYNKFDDIYLDPQDIDDFIDGLRYINPNIEVRQEVK